MAKDQSDPSPAEVEQAYRFGRSFPKMETDAKNNTAKVQFPEDKRDKGYDNATRAGWLNGRGSPYPGFDRTPRGKKPY
jgi:hypothetical protein